MNDQDAFAIASSVVERLEKAWNTADAAAFASEFAGDADFVNVRGDYHQGRAAIEGGHRGIWNTIYAGSSARYRLERARNLTDDVIIAHVDANLSVPSGPLAGSIDAIPSLILVRTGGEWKIASFHNTTKAR